ncbi:MAG: acyl-CoA dehydratase activase, partial [Dehalococcoidia bacterium]
MARFMGIDIGSGTSKGVITGDGELEVYHMLASGINYRTASLKLREELLAKAGIYVEDIARTITTGHGAGVIPFGDRHMADMHCCASGINRIFPSARTIIDVQSQSIQVIRVDEKGNVTGFGVSEACASGSGCFIEVIANVLQVKLEDIGPLSLSAKNPVAFTTGCAVFGESEAISRVAEGVPKEDILAGVHMALAGRISALIDRVGLKNPCAISGGGGLNTGLIKIIEEEGVQLLIPPQPQIVNALGAALLAE